ncbi:MAG: biotin/lipoyl-binding protein [Bacteroidales bacterium]|nr:biotin/lipoyl-binding protein [Bacteroidales bacterium]
MAKEEKKETPKTCLNIDGEKYKTLLTSKYTDRKKWEEPNPKQFYSQIPGTVLKIYVKEGQKVKEGELMMVLEAMKMKNKIRFSADGVVKKVHVDEGQKIPKDFLMIEME